MWCAYAVKNGVALVFNIDPFLKKDSEIAAFTMPMYYYEYEKF